MGIRLALFVLLPALAWGQPGPIGGLDPDLRCLGNLSSSGVLARTGAATCATRSIAVSDTASFDASVANGDGVSGNPTLSGAVLPAGVDHNALANLATGDVHTQYTLRAGRATTGNDTTLSTNADGTLTGSALTSGNQVLNLRSQATASAGSSVRITGPQTWLLGDDGVTPPSLRIYNPALGAYSLLQFELLAGGVTSSEHLTLRSNTSGTKTSVRVNDTLVVGKDTTAEALIHAVADDPDQPGILIGAHSDDTVGLQPNSVLALRRSKGTFASPTNLTSAATIGTLLWQGRGNGDYRDGAALEAYSTEAWDTTPHYGTQLSVYLNKTGATSVSERLRFLGNGDLTSFGRLNVQPESLAGSGNVTTSDTVINCAAAQSCDFTGVQRGDQIVVGTQPRLVTIVTTSACPATGSNVNCRVTVTNPGFTPDLTASAWTYRKAAIYVPHGTDAARQAFIVSPDGEAYVGQAASCSTPPCAPHAVLGATGTDVGTVGAGSPNTGRDAQQIFRIVGGKGQSRSIDGGGSGIGGAGAAVTLNSGPGGDVVGYDLGGAGGSYSFNSGPGGDLSSGNTGVAGPGGPFSINGGSGGAVIAGSTASTAGTGATLSIAAGPGGNAPAGNTNGNGGNLLLNAGLAGAGAGTAGSNGSVVLGSNNTVVAVGGGTAGGLFAIAEPSAAGSNVVLLTGVAMSSNLIVPAVTVAVGGEAYAHSMYGGL